MKVVVFSKQDCNPCGNVKQFLTKLGVGYEEVNAFDHPDEAAIAKIRTVPTTIVYDKEGTEFFRSKGYNPNELSELKGL